VESLREEVLENTLQPLYPVKHPIRWGLVGRFQRARTSLHLRKLVQPQSNLPETGGRGRQRAPGAAPTHLVFSRKFFLQTRFAHLFQLCLDILAV